jgi:hypothetical protein
LCSIVSIRSSGLLRVLALVGVVVSAPGCASTPKPTVEDEIVVRLVAVTWRGEFLADDPQDGFLVPVGHTGFTRINSLTVTPDDRVLSVAQRDGGANPVLIEIDPDTGRGTVVCTLDRPVDVRALAAAPTGMLYAAIARPEDQNRNSIVEIDTATGRVAVVMDLNVIGMQAMEFCPHGELFAFANASRNVTTGAARAAAVLRIYQDDWSLGRVSDVDAKHPVQSLAFDACDVGHLAWRPNAHLHEGPSPIARTVVDPETRTITIADIVFDPTGADIRGIGFLGARRRWEQCGCADHASHPMPPLTSVPKEPDP